jgi:hypothetical protein
MDASLLIISPGMSLRQYTLASLQTKHVVQNKTMSANVIALNIMQTLSVSGYEITSKTFSYAAPASIVQIK